MADIQIIIGQLQKFEKDLPKPLGVLMEALKNGSKASSHGAICMQYPVHAYAATADEAFILLLGNLVNYLEYCKTKKTETRAQQNKLYREAFKSGKLVTDETVKAAARHLKLEVKERVIQSLEKQLELEIRELEIVA